MVKKRLANGEPCEKCAQTEAMLRRRGVWDRIDEVAWAVEGDDASAGVELGRLHGVEVAPFFVLRFDDGSEDVYTSGMKLLRDHLSGPVSVAPARAEEERAVDAALVRALADRWKDLEPLEIVRQALGDFRDRCAVVLTGAEDVVLLDMAVRSGLPFHALFADTGRHRSETYALIDELSRHYGAPIQSLLPARDELSDLLENRGQNSFLHDGHAECCSIRRLGPLRRALSRYDAWIGHQRLARELENEARPEVAEFDGQLASDDERLIRVNPLLAWDDNALWSYVRKHAVPHNELHDRGYRFIGCEPCTRAIRPDQPDSDGLWWWEWNQPTGSTSASEGEGEGEGI